jgi:hypothetical protein
MSTGSFVPGSCHDGNRTAVRMPSGPASRNRGANRCRSVGERLADHDRGAAARGRGVHAGFGRDLGEAVRAVAPHAQFGRLGRGREHDRAAVGAENPPDMQVGWGNRRRRGQLGGRGDDQPPGVLADPRPGDPAVRQQCGRAADDVGPVLVGVLREDFAGERAGHADRPLVPGLRDEQQVRAPADADQVGERGGVPGDRRQRAGGDIGDIEGHVRIRGAGGRVLPADRLAVGVRGIGDVPGVHGVLVDACEQYPHAVRRPPVAAGASHFLGRDEFGEPEGNPVFRRDPAIRAAFKINYPKRPLVYVSDPPPCWIEPGVERRRLGRDEAGLGRAVPESGRIDLPRQGEGGQGVGGIGGERHDAGAGFPDALTAGPFLRRQVLLVGADQPRVGDQALRASGGINLPQAVHGVSAVFGPDERNAAAVRGDLEGPGHAEREVAGPCALPRKALGHAP